MTETEARVEDALAAPIESRPARLLAAARFVDADSALDPSSRAELRAIVESELARLGLRSTERARLAVSEAEKMERPGWPNYYVAQALIAHDQFEEAIEELDRIPTGFFEERDLMWRLVHCWEMAAIAKFELRSNEAALEEVDRITAHLARHGESDDLAPPVDLVNWALGRLEERPIAREALVTMARSIDVNDWFEASLRLV